MTLKTSKDPGGSVFVLTICDACGTDDYASEEKLLAAGWHWDDYPDGPHYCPDPDHSEVDDEPDYDAYKFDGSDNPNYREAMKDAGRGHLLP